MYLWNYYALAKKFKEHRITPWDKFQYLMAILLYIPTGLMGSNWIPGMYRTVYRSINQLLALEAPQIPPLQIFNDFNFVTDIATMVIIALGITVCFFANRRGDGRNFIERFMCMSIPITLRVSFYILLLFIIAMGVSILYFFFKLQAIATVRGFLRAFKQLRKLKELVPSMAYMSYGMHIFSCVLSLLSLTLSFLILRVQLLFISGARDTRKETS